MESREILIANTKTQRNYRITTDASTLGELKAAMDAAGIDYSDMDFTEGIERKMLLDDSSTIPEYVMFKGARKNPAILLTNTKKNIKSGAEDRKTAYEKIKELCLQDEIKELYGRNYTQVPTPNLWDVINDCMEEDDEDETQYPGEENFTSVHTAAKPTVESIAEAIYDLVKLLAVTSTVSVPELKGLAETIDELAGRMKVEEGDAFEGKDKDTLSEEELNEVIAGIL